MFTKTFKNKIIIVEQKINFKLIQNLLENVNNLNKKLA